MYCACVAHGGKGAPDPAFVQAWRSSRLAELPEPAARELLPLARERALDADTVLAPDTVILGPVIEGQIGVFLLDRAGCRSVMMRYIGPGDIVGLAATVLPAAGASGIEIEFRALEDTRVLELPRAEFRRLALEDARIAWQAAQWAVADMISGHAVLFDDLFLPVRRRVARHLLDLAVRDNGDLVVSATQDTLAEAVGSVRAVVARALAGLRQNDLVERDRRGLVLVDPDALHAVARGDA